MKINIVSSSLYQRLVPGGCYPVMIPLNRAAVSAGLLLALLLSAGCESARHNSTGNAVMYPPARTKESQAAMSPQAALAELRVGNARFLAGKSQQRNLPARVAATASG